MYVEFICDHEQQLIHCKETMVLTTRKTRRAAVLHTEKAEGRRKVIFRFDKQTASALSKWDLQELKGIGLELPTEHDCKNAFDFILTSSAPDALLPLKYKDSNLLLLEDTTQLVLKVFFGKYRPGNTVNFLRTQYSLPFRSFQSGGGRDWIVFYVSVFLSNARKNIT